MMTAKLLGFENHNAYMKTREQVSWFLSLCNFSGIIEPMGKQKRSFCSKSVLTNIVIRSTFQSLEKYFFTSKLKQHQRKHTDKAVLERK